VEEVDPVQGQTLILQVLLVDQEGVPEQIIVVEVKQVQVIHHQQVPFKAFLVGVLQVVVKQVGVVEVQLLQVRLLSMVAQVLVYVVLILDLQSLQ
tara:strand:+ start:346 stop:630 length:285 start_codon:yes stop_codon:yes gene_type:complete